MVRYPSGWVTTTNRPYSGSLPASDTVPPPAARTGVPIVTAMSSPVWGSSDPSGRHHAAGDVSRVVERPVRRRRRADLQRPMRAGHRRPDRRRERERVRQRHRIGDDVGADHFPQPAISPLRAVQRGGELPHLGVLRLQPGHVVPELGHAGGRAQQRRVERAHDQRRHREDGARQHQAAEQPERHPEGARLEFPVPVHHHRDPRAGSGHPSNGAPRMSSSRRARSSFE